MRFEIKWAGANSTISTKPFGRFRSLDAARGELTEFLRFHAESYVNMIAYVAGATPLDLVQTRKSSPEDATPRSYGVRKDGLSSAVELTPGGAHEHFSDAKAELLAYLREELLAHLDQVLNLSAARPEDFLPLHRRRALEKERKQKATPPGTSPSSADVDRSAASPSRGNGLLQEGVEDEDAFTFETVIAPDDESTKMEDGPSLSESSLGQEASGERPKEELVTEEVREDGVVKDDHGSGAEGREKDGAEAPEDEAKEQAGEVTAPALATKEEATSEDEKASEGDIRH